MDIIYIKDLRIDAVIGIYGWERQIKQTIILDLDAERITEIILQEFNVPWVRLQLNKKGALRGAKDVGIIIERGHKVT